MARRQLEEINAGSMADIAFLLLIFFLVTTTMDTDEGIVRTLPQKMPDIPNNEIVVNERDVFEVLVNYNDQLLVENEYIQIEQLREKTREFLTNPSNKETLPEMIRVTKATADAKIMELKALLAGKDSASVTSGIWKAELSDWKDKRDAVDVVGDFYSLPKLAIISLRNDVETSYEMYVRVQDEMQGAINELRNEWSMKAYGEKYTDWSPSKDADKEKMRIIRAIIPQRIAEQQPKSVAGY